MHLTLIASLCLVPSRGQEQPKEPINPSTPGPIPKHVLNERTSTQSSKTPVSRLGLGVEEVSPHKEGLRVLAVVQGSPAERVGLKAGDILERFDDQLLIASKQLEVLVKKSPVGREAILGVNRNDESLTIPVILEAAKPSLTPSPELVSRDFEITRRVVRLTVGSKADGTGTTVVLTNQGQQAQLVITAQDAVEFDGPIREELQIPPHLRPSIQKIATLKGGKWYFRLPDPPPVGEKTSGKSVTNFDK